MAPGHTEEQPDHHRGRSSLLIGFPARDDPEAVYDDYVVVSLLHVMQAQPVDAVESS